MAQTSGAALPAKVADLAREKGMGGLLATCKEAGPIARCLLASLVLLAGLGFLAVLNFADIGVGGARVLAIITIGFSGLYIVAVLVGSIFNGRKRTYVFENGVVRHINWRVKGITWAETDKAWVSTGNNFLGPVGRLLGRIGLKQDSVIGTATLIALWHGRDFFEFESGKSESFGEIVVTQLRHNGIPIEYRD